MVKRARGTYLCIICWVTCCADTLHDFPSWLQDKTASVEKHLKTQEEEAGAEKGNQELGIMLSHRLVNWRGYNSEGCVWRRQMQERQERKRSNWICVCEVWCRFRSKGFIQKVCPSSSSFFASWTPFVVSLPLVPSLEHPNSSTRFTVDETPAWPENTRIGYRIVC